MKEILKISHLGMIYNQTTVGLKDINFSVHEGEFVCVIGPSGAGKSTLLRSINRLITPTSGTIEFLNLDITKASAKKLRFIRSKIGMVFQNYNLIYRLSVLENVLHGRLGYMSNIKGLLGAYSKKDKLLAIKLLKNIGLDEQIYKRADELSGGQKQRVGICRALCQNPQLMLADEPIASLDPKTAIDVMDAIYQGCQRDGIACIANLHQVDIAKKYATRIIGIKKGEIVFDDIPDKLTDEIIEMLYEGKNNELENQNIMSQAI